MKKILSVLMVAVALILTAAVPRAMEQVREVRVGYLSCYVSSGFGSLVASSRDRNCTFTSSDGKTVGDYKGDLGKFGADIGYLASGVMLWEVLAPSNTTTPGALAGHYAGATAGTTVGIGVGVHVLTRGLHGTIALQPIAIEGDTGLKVVAGVATMNLRYVMER
jgi:hypothetical protein